MAAILGGALRFAGLGTRDFWYDESCTFFYVHHLLSWPAESSVLIESTNLPYYALLRGWTWLFGDTESAYRSMSALAATLAIPLLALFSRRLTVDIQSWVSQGSGVCEDRQNLGGLPVQTRERPDTARTAVAQASLVGAVCAALVAFHPLHIHYAHEARAYALWMLSVSGLLWLLYEAARRLRAKWWAAYGLLLFACLHLHYYTLWWLPASVVGVALAADRRRALRHWALTNVLVALAFAPYFFLAVWPAARGGGGAWIEPAWDPIGAIPRTLWAFMPAGAYPAHLRGLSLLSPDTVAAHPAWLAAMAQSVPPILIVVLALVVGRVALLRSNSAGSRFVGGDGAGHAEAGTPTAIYTFLLGMTVLPLVLAWGYSLAIRPNYLVGRYDLIAWPAFVVTISLLIGQAAQLLPRHAGKLAATLCATLVLCSLVPIQRMAALKPPPTYHHVRAERLADLTQQSDLVVTFSYDRFYLIYYLYRAGFNADLVNYPSWLDRQIGWVDTQADVAIERRNDLAADARTLTARVERTLSSDGHAWLVADSLSRGAPGAREPINRYFFDTLTEAGYALEVADADLGLFAIVPLVRSPR